MKFAVIHMEIIWSIILAIFVVGIYSLLTGIRLLRLKIIHEEKSSSASVRLALFQRITGFMLFGFLPLLVIRLIPGRSLADYGIQTKTVLKGLMFALPFALVIVPFSYFNSGRKDNLERYPVFRLRIWDWNSLVVSALSWIIYLIAYEFLFRGFFLFSCLHSFSMPVAIFINICLYSLAHIPKGIKEIIGSVPVGIILCLLVIKVGTIWVAVFIHIMMALSNEWFSIAAHPDMKFKLRKTGVL